MTDFNLPYSQPVHHQTVVNTIIREAAVHGDAEVTFPAPLASYIDLCDLMFRCTYSDCFSILDWSAFCCQQELSVYKMMEQHGFSFVAENDRDEHQLIKQKMAELDSLGPATVGLDVYAARVIDACNTFLKHAQVGHTRLPFTLRAHQRPFC